MLIPAYAIYLYDKDSDFDSDSDADSDPDLTRLTLPDGTKITTLISIKQNPATESRTLSVEKDNRIYKYDMGYGDFCFGRLINRRACHRWSLDLPLTGENVVFKEINNFQRTGPFPFFKIPIEIRFRIFGLLLEPFRNGSANGGIEVYLTWREKNMGSDLGYFGGSYEEYCTERTKLDRLLSLPNPKSAVKVKSTKEEEDKQHQQKVSQFELEKWRYWQSHKLQPNCHQGYEMSCYPRFGYKKDWTIVALVRNISNVSCQFRAEFAKVFFTNVHVCMENNNSISAIHPFLNDRPSAITGIKSLSIQVDVSELRGTNEKESEEALNHIAKTMKLDSFTISLDISTSELFELANKQGIFSWLKTTTLIPVAKRFKVYLSVFAWDEFRHDEEEEREGYECKLQDEYEDLITDLLLPDSLRKTPEVLENTA